MNLAVIGVLVQEKTMTCYNLYDLGRLQMNITGPRTPEGRRIVPVVYQTVGRHRPHVE